MRITELRYRIELATDEHGRWYASVEHFPKGKDFPGSLCFTPLADGPLDALHLASHRLAEIRRLAQ